MIRHESMSAPLRTLLLTAAVAFLGCVPERAKVAAAGDADAPAPPAQPEVTLFGVHMRMYRGSDLMMVGRGAKVEYHRDTADLRADEALLRFPSRPSGARAAGNAVAGLEVRAPQVSGNLYTRQAEAHGGVILRTASGMVGETERALFDGTGMKVHGPEPVEITGPGYRLNAGGFDFVFADESFTFTGETDTVIGGQP